MRERQRRRKYAREQRHMRQRRDERIKTMEMLLSAHGCRWDNSKECFVLQEYNENGVSRRTYFLDLDGNEIPNPWGNRNDIVDAMQYMLEGVRF